MEQIVQVLAWNDCAVGFVKRKGASRRTRRVDTKVYFMQTWAMEPLHNVS